LSLSTSGPPPSLPEIVREARSIHERFLKAAIHTRRTTGTCLYAAILLASIVRKFGALERVLIRGGGQGDGGYRDKHGVLRGHYWVETHDHGRVTVIDITADQFGGDPVTILDQSQAFDYIPGRQEEIDNHVNEIGDGNFL